MTTMRTPGHRWVMVLLLAVIMSCFEPLSAQSQEGARADQPAPAAGEPAGPTDVKVGMFITQLGDFDMAKRTFSATFWAWFLHNNEEYNPHETIEVVNAKSDAVKFSSLDTSKGVRWHQEKHTALLAQDWDTTYFPFDRQVLHVVLEDGQQDAEHVRFIADTAASRIDPAVKVPGWTIEDFKIEDRKNTYETSYGDPTLQNSSYYSQIKATITVKRDGVRLLCNLFIGFIIAYLLAVLSFFLDYKEMAGTRIGLCAAAVFAAIGNKYTLDNFLPPSPGFTLSDVIVASSFISIILAALSVVVIQAVRNRSPEHVRMVNNGFAAVTALGVLAVNVIAVMRALA